MRRSFRYLLVLFVLPWIAPLAAQEYGLRPGDRVVISFYTAAGDEIDEVTGERIIDRDGNIFLPYVGTVSVEALDAVAIRELLQRRYQPYYDDPVVDIEARLRVSVTGSVGSPGIYYVDPTTTIIEALATAGGSGTEFAVNSNIVPADPSRVRLVRDGEVRIIDIRPEQITRALLTLRVQSGDWIDVPPRGRSRIRDEITFWGSVVGFVTSVLLLSGAIGN